MTEDFIVIDVETTGLIPGKFQIVSIGAVDSRNGEEFYKECSIFQTDEISESALSINGFTEDQIRDINKPNPIDIFKEFLQWCEGRPKLLAGHNIGSFDIQFLKFLNNSIDEESRKKWKFGYHYLDLHSMAFLHFGESLSHRKIAQRLGLPEEPIPHNALSGARSEMACIKKLISIT